MRACVLTVAMLLGALSSAGATQASWPISSIVEFPTPQATRVAGATATVRVEVSDAARDIDVRVYGLDGMRIGHSNITHVHRDGLAAGAGFSFPVTIHPGAGRSFVVVSARARFARIGDGGTVRTFPFGEENAVQRAEHTRCVRQDPDGAWIRDPDCAAPPSTP